MRACIKKQYSVVYRPQHDYNKCECKFIYLLNLLVKKTKIDRLNIILYTTHEGYTNIQTLK